MNNQIRKIKRVEDLPPWFDLVKYEAARSMDAGNWGLHLMVRASIRRSIKEEQPLSQSEKDAVVSILQKPIEPPEGVDGDWERVGNVRPMTMDDAFELARALIGHSDQLSNFWIMFSEERVNRPNDTFDWNWSDSEMDTIYAEVDSFGLDDTDPPWCYAFPHLTVNLDATDEQLVEDFKLWLSDWRKTVKKNVRANIFTKERFHKWVDERLLPCLDLMIWEELVGVEITHQVMADKLQLNSAERIRRTTRKNANELVEEKTIGALLSQANSRTGKIK